MDPELNIDKMVENILGLLFIQIGLRGTFNGILDNLDINELVKTFKYAYWYVKQGRSQEFSQGDGGEIFEEQNFFRN